MLLLRVPPVQNRNDARATDIRMKKTGSIVPNAEGWTVVSQYGELEEDIAPTEPLIRYGHRSDPNSVGDDYSSPADRTSGCNYKSNDTPSMNLLKMWTEMGRTKTRFLECRYLCALRRLYVIDSCDHNRTVNSITLDMSCCNLLQVSALRKPELANKGVVADAKPPCGAY